MAYSGYKDNVTASDDCPHPFAAVVALNWLASLMLAIEFAVAHSWARPVRGYISVSAATDFAAAEDNR